MWHPCWPSNQSKVFKSLTTRHGPSLGVAKTSGDHFFAVKWLLNSLVQRERYDPEVLFAVWWVGGRRCGCGCGPVPGEKADARDEPGLIYSISDLAAHDDGGQEGVMQNP